MKSLNLEFNQAETLIKMSPFTILLTSKNYSAIKTLQFAVSRQKETRHLKVNDVELVDSD